MFYFQAGVRLRARARMDNACVDRFDRLIVRSYQDNNLCRFSRDAAMGKLLVSSTTLTMAESNLEIWL